MKTYLMLILVATFAWAVVVLPQQTCQQEETTRQLVPLVEKEGN
jgi:hypothetical protein